MKLFFAKTFGGLTTSYYVRNFIFGLPFAISIVFLLSSNQSASSAKYGMAAFAIINCLLYPYSRFVYESIVDFIMGNNVFYVNALFMIFVKLNTMILCWSLAVFIAPIGLIYLFLKNSREAVNKAEGD
jgi:hypothetical protein